MALWHGHCRQVRESARSSIIRRHVSAEPKDGEMMDSWVLASDTESMNLSVRSYYGLPIDIGTPGFRAGGALPVELSYFRPVRDQGNWGSGDYLVDGV